MWNKRGLDDIRKAAECFEQAVEEDPSFALGYVGLADCAVLVRNNWKTDLEANLEKAKAGVAKALELDPGLAEAHTTKAMVLVSEYNLRDAEEEYRRAIELKPSYATAHQWYSLLLRHQLRWDEALDQIEKAVELDPLSPIINLNHATLYWAKRDWRKALELYRRVFALDPGYPGIHGNLGAACGMMKMYDDMRREFATFVELYQGTYPHVRIVLNAWSAYFEDDRQTVRRLLPELEATLQESLLGAYEIATFCFYLGENDRGFEWLERSYSMREDSLLGMKSEPDMDRVRTDRRYLDLLKRLGLDQTPQANQWDWQHP